MYTFPSTLLPLLHLRVLNSPAGLSKHPVDLFTGYVFGTLGHAGSFPFTPTLSLKRAKETAIEGVAYYI